MYNFFRNITKRSLLFINIVVALLLLATIFIPSVNPQKFWAIGLLSLATPFIAIINIAFLIFWLLLAKWKYIFISLLAIIFSWEVFSVGFAFNIKKQKNVHNKKTLSVMSYNVRLLDLYKWTKSKNARVAMLSFLQNQNADVLCLQEFFSSQDSTGIQNVKDIAQLCGYKYNAACKNFETKRGFFGDIIFSKFPIQNSQSLVLDTSILSHKFQYADIAIDTANVVRVFNLHLASVKLSENEKKLFNTKSLDDEFSIEKSKNILYKLKLGFQKRARQVGVVSNEIKKSIYPCIVCGDLNDIPSSYTYFGIRGKLKDAFLDKGIGLGRTYTGISPIMRIDNIFYNANKFYVGDFKIIKKYYSDHYALKATLLI